MLIATGKNVRKALITATGIQTGSPWPPSQITTIGAIARIGTVCEPTTYGMEAAAEQVREVEDDADRDADDRADDEADRGLLAR